MMENLADKVKEYYWYHCIRLGDIYTDGDYDLEPLIPKYGIPEDLRGKTALDVGRASGFFSFLMEERGADVTATDLPSYLDWDFVGGGETVEQRRGIIGSEAAFSQREIVGAFDFACAYRHSKVKSKLINVYDLDPEVIGGMFDLVFCGSLLSHLRDPILALEKLYNVTGEMLILACPIMEEESPVPLMALVGTSDSDRRSWWVPNVACVMEMLRCANFKRVEHFSSFPLINRRVELTVPHAVFHAYRNA
jgi:SAM-dependent methyltransferase